MIFSTNATQRIQSWVSDITGPALLRYNVYLAFAPVFVITSILSNIHVFSLSNVAGWFVSNLLAIAVCVLLVVGFHFLTIKRRPGRRPSLFGVLSFGLLLGAVKGSLTTVFAIQLGVEASYQPMLPRTLQAAILGLVTLPALALLSATQLRYEAERSSLIAERVASALDSAEGSPLGDDERDELRIALQDIRMQLVREDHQSVPPLLRQVVAQVLRPITHKLWEREEVKHPGFGFAELSRLAVRTKPFAATPTALILAIGSYSPFLIATNPISAFFRSLLTGCLIFLTYKFSSLVRPKGIFLGYLHFLTVNLLIALGVVWLGEVLLGPVPSFSFPVAVTVFFIWIAQTGFMCSFLLSALATRDEIRQRLRSDEALSKVSASAEKYQKQFSNRKLANYLHSHVQNRILSLAMKAEQGNQTDIIAEIEELEASLSATNALGFSSDMVNPQYLVKIWDGIASINLELQAACRACATDPKMFELLSEAINNSVRHGLAQNIDVIIQCASNPDSHLVQVMDDGLGPTRGQPGLGSKFYSSLSAGKWTLSAREQGGAVLSLEVVR